MFIDSSLYIFFMFYDGWAYFFSHEVTMKSLFCLSCYRTLSWCLFKFFVGIGFFYRIHSFGGRPQGFHLIFGIHQEEKGCIQTFYRV